MLYQQLREELKDAMRAKDELRLGVIRGLLTGITNELVAKGKKPTDEPSEDEVLVVVKRAAKQRQDSIEQFRKGGREDLAGKEEKELALLSVYMPPQMGKEEIVKVVEAKKAELGIMDKSGMGKLMSAVMGELKGKADGKDVKEAVESALSPA